jgi:4-hydroxy-tetrahydrodipicolinate synthase
MMRTLPRTVAPSIAASRIGGNDMTSLDLRGLVPAPVTPFTRDGEVDHAAVQRLGAWLGGFNGVKGLVVLGHAGEGTFLTADEQTAVIESFRTSVDGKFPSLPELPLKAPRWPHWRPSGR